MQSFTSWYHLSPFAGTSEEGEDETKACPSISSSPVKNKRSHLVSGKSKDLVSCFRLVCNDEDLSSISLTLHRQIKEAEFFD